MNKKVNIRRKIRTHLIHLVLVLSLVIYGCGTLSNDFYGIESKTKYKEEDTMDTLISINGDKYVGEFKDGMMHGQGTYTYVDGAIFVGDNREGKMHGHGTYTWVDGVIYVGELRDGKRHGQGTMTMPDGDKYVGEWKDDRAYGGWYYWDNGQKTYSYEDESGKWIHSTKGEGKKN